jgi:carbon storage regulator
MLVLTRKPGQAINFKLPSGEVIVVHVLSVKGSGIRIGIEAPRSIGILRSELPEVATKPAA